MSLEMTIVMLIAAWLAVASAMFWGVMRISRRHHHPVERNQAVEPAGDKTQKGRHATAH
ncbi:hypothetical protein M2401_003739 [Pseudomonas sp. JUb42]|jgi:hypothetical protein|uniref:hypothetical protein n=1 Tax=Pseudomonas sp. JUb42 TaxID=2940611 RepID=UPI00216708FD|nr:hypothetical protein [Pseudomonas sp. JUb42]MCS3469989.1 hypothetical protein [Pseudomonas sp. JUb42]